ncbi:glyoxalase superfamily protein [Pedobacter foliorum]|uniref:glyoxalase superfamily protein n=1 Tax=Pedobacter foliorum TaxID=2739058 RepID=UPI0015636C4E|nr:glyoxalase superfamily protein [Pedobacter foliorum]NRF40218.1 VOC family protein [Pedobacter foliorum]
MSTVKPILRIFDYDKAIEFYINWLGFKIDWEHPHDHGSPKYMEVTLRGITFNLSEHHGDASPGSHISIVDFEGLRTYHKELNAKKYKYNNPGLEVPEWNPKAITVTVHDPFGNRITFTEEE